jgi:glycosyltransferase involved in cell wall biosynthesis
MRNKPRVSVITIFLNAEKFIEEAIASVLAQTYPHWELLLVDDGSTDASTMIAHRYAAQYPNKVRYLEHPEHQNRGMSASRNLGIGHAQGEYIAFLDADDVYLPLKLERQVPLLDEHPEAAMVYGATSYWYSWTGEPADVQRDAKHKPRLLGVQPDTLVNPPELATLFLRREAQTPGTCAVLVRREAIQRTGGFEEAFRGMYEDQVFFYKVCLAEPVFVESGNWDRYRMHPDSCCHVVEKTRRAYAARMAFLKWLEQYLSAQGTENVEVRKILQRQKRWLRLKYIRQYLMRALRALRRRMKNILKYCQ